MSKAGAPAMGTFRAQWARCLGLDRNPLRRTVDRVETFVRLTVLILLLAGVPAGLFVAGRISDQVFLQQARAQRSSDRQVTAVLTQPAPTVGTVDPYSSVQTTWANAQWMAPNGTAHSGQVLVAAGAPRGATARVWINAAGAITDPPVGHRDVMAEVAVTVMVTGITLILLLLGAEALAVRSLDHRRFSAWDAEWRATGPQWTDHRT